MGSGNRDADATFPQAQAPYPTEGADNAEGRPSYGEVVACDPEVQDDIETPDDDGDDVEAGGGPLPSPARSVLVFGLVIVVCLAGLVGWLGYGTCQSYRTEQRRDFFVAAGRQAALNLTSVSYTQADADAQRILTTATGPFYEDFQRRAPTFVEVVKQVQSKSTGTVVAAGLESETGDRARVLVTVSVASSTAATPDQPKRIWRMRMHLRKVGIYAKVSNVEFVP